MPVVLKESPAAEAVVHVVPPATARTRRAESKPAPRCSSCHLKELCLPRGLLQDDLERLDHLNFTRRRVKAGDVLYRAGDRFDFTYAVRSGTFKSSLPLPDGREQVTGFQLAGEVLGLNGLASGKHVCTAIALEDAEVCAIPYSDLIDASMATPNLQLAMSRVMSREIVREHKQMLMLGSMTAEERLAAFLLNISQRLQARGYSPSEFHLRMLRVEIGSYLGLKLETVSRLFSAFQRRGILEVLNKHVRIINFAALERLVETA